MLACPRSQGSLAVLPMVPVYTELFYENTVSVITTQAGIQNKPDSKRLHPGPRRDDGIFALS
jgi:hypothetical protein